MFFGYLFQYLALAGIFEYTNPAPKTERRMASMKKEIEMGIQVTRYIDIGCLHRERWNGQSACIHTCHACHNTSTKHRSRTNWTAQQPACHSPPLSRMT